MLTIPDIIEALQELGEDRRQLAKALLEAQQTIHRVCCLHAPVPSPTWPHCWNECKAAQRALHWERTGDE